MKQHMKVHERGDCVDPAYGGDWCSGWATFAPSPYAWELYDDDTPVWMCDGERAGSAADI